MKKQVDPGVDSGVVPPPLPDIQSIEEIVADMPSEPPMLIDGILHQGCKMILGGPSKSNKSWCLLDLAISVASGQPWWNKPTSQNRVLYLNFELQDWAIASRLNSILSARPECKLNKKTLHVWNLRGHNADLSLLRPRLEEQLALHSFGLLILDPAYKLLGDRDENSNGDINSLMNEFEALAQSTNAAVVLAHHFAKGNAAAKEAIDRMSGAGVWMRDPDAIMSMTNHEEEGSFTVSSYLRNLPQIPEFTVSWKFPLMSPSGLNPESIKRPQAKQKICPDSQFLQQAVGSEGKAWNIIIKDAQSKLSMSKATASRYLERLSNSNQITIRSGLYWIT